MFAIYVNQVSPLSPIAKDSYEIKWPSLLTYNYVVRRFFENVFLRTAIVCPVNPSQSLQQNPPRLPYILFRVRIKTSLTAKVSFGSILFDKTRLKSKSLLPHKMPVSLRPFCLADELAERYHLPLYHDALRFLLKGEGPLPQQLQTTAQSTIYTLLRILPHSCSYTQTSLDC